ncbi:ABC transporter permease [Calditerricola satsumensis]|uniref:Dipeptide transport system permease protein DppB n=1 Tax=Calditerricola satsumensis TaxID=373054 RepID=A0A8J3BAX8_9BACI|nr:ABC transporter permease [Calditerricola satsumensis]GGJ93064.1 dipeptide transport system permease protein DppB [Calditerricola satsumensis]
MLRYILKRLGWMLLTLWVIITLTFILMHSIPGDPFSQDGKKYPEPILKNLRAKYHLDEPLPVQYVLYLKNLLMLDLGPSIKSDTRTVNDVIADGFPVSFQLGLAAVALALVVGILLGVLAALRHGSWLDNAATAVAVVGISVPSFVMAPLLQKYFGLKWKLLPVAQWGSFEHLILPAFALSLGPLAVIARLTRSSMLDVLGQDYIRTAKAKGLSQPATVFRHALRNALMPVITYLGPLLAAILTGTFVIEKIFAIPGLGKYFVESIINRDYPMIMGTTIFYSAILVVMMLLVDLAYTLVDPRIKLASKED